MLVLARHATTTLNEKGWVQGKQDLGLSESGQQQVHRLARWLAAGFVPRSIATSPARRAVETAQLLLHHLGADIVIEQAEELLERDYGPFEGLDDEQLRFMRERQGLPPHDPRQNWMHAEKVESDRQVWLRFRAFADRADLIARAAESDVLLITHGGTIKAVICSELGIPPDRPFPFKIDPASAAALAVRDQHLQLCLLWQNDDRTATANFVESR